MLLVISTPLMSTHTFIPNTLPLCQKTSPRSLPSAPPSLAPFFLLLTSLDLLLLSSTNMLAVTLCGRVTPSVTPRLSLACFHTICSTAEDYNTHILTYC